MNPTIPDLDEFNPFIECLQEPGRIGSDVGASLVDLGRALDSSTAQ
jgi:hypothetical protein